MEQTRRCRVQYSVLLTQQMTQSATRKDVALGEGMYSISAVQYIINSTSDKAAEHE